MADGGLAERLAEKWLLDNPEIVDTGNDAEDRRVCGRDARWWLNEIAEELERTSDVVPVHKRRACEWLRAQAKDGDDG